MLDVYTTKLLPSIPYDFSVNVSSWGGSFAIKADGTLWSFSTNQYGGLGHNNTQNYSSPNQVGTDTNWIGPINSGWQGTSVIGGI